MESTHVSSPGDLEDADSFILQQRNAPASAEVYRQMRQRFLKLSEIPNPQEESPIFTSLDVQEVRNLGTRLASQLVMEDKSDEAILQLYRQAQTWLHDMLSNHAKILKREHYVRMFRLAIEKELAGLKERWTQMEKVYMTLTCLTEANPNHRLRMTLIMVLGLNFTEQLAHVSNLAKQRSEGIQRIAVLNEDANDIRSSIFDRAQRIRVDHFACAIPLANLESRADIVDDNQGCCPICQYSYTDLTISNLPDLLADYPVRIKYCGHIIGKSCLEQWMSTPKIDEAKYPHRTCPLCRVKIEGVNSPRYPKSLRTHIKMNRIASETLRELAYGWDMDMEECMDAIVTCMSEEIACEELSVFIKDTAGKTRKGYENDERMLQEKMEKVKQERWVWGLAGNHVWRKMRDEWMNSGIARRS